MKRTGLMLSLSLSMMLTAAEPPALPLKGIVQEALSGGRYTYIQLGSETSPVWVACYAIPAKAGDPVEVRQGTKMTAFHSPTLNRTFDSILFASEITVATNTIPSRVATIPVSHPAFLASPTSNASPPLPVGHPPLHPAPPATASGTLRGVVQETIEGGGYTYVKIDTDAGEIWIAANRFPVRVGDRVTSSSGMVMNDFKSPTLGRTFARIHFVEDIRVADRNPAELR